MGSGRRRTLIVLAAATIAGAGAGIVIGLSEDDGSPPSAGSARSAGDPGARPSTERQPPDRPGGEGEDLPPVEDDPAGDTAGPSGPAPEGPDEEGAASAARGYIQALDRRSGAAVCRAFAPGALEALEFPAERSSCAATVEASLGTSKRGTPAWRHSEMTDAVSAAVSGATAKVVATVFTTYSDVREPTIEDDIIYLTRDGERWFVAKPSLTLYRAIGNADPPARALAPPG